jgi:hypothetical protein
VASARSERQILTGGKDHLGDRLHSDVVQLGALGARTFDTLQADSVAGRLEREIAGAGAPGDGGEGDNGMGDLDRVTVRRWGGTAGEGAGGREGEKGGAAHGAPLGFPGFL